MHVLHHVHTAGKDQIVQPELLHQGITLLRIVLIVHAAHDVQANLRNPGGKLKEGVDHGFDILDRGQTHYSANIDPTVLRLERDVAKALILHAIGDNDAFAAITAHFDLSTAGVIEQTAYPERSAVDILGQHIKEADPTAFERGNDPVGTDDLFFALARIDAVLCQKHRRMVHAAAQTGQQAAISGGDRMIDLRFWHASGQQVQHRQQHGAHGVKSVSIGDIGIFLQADIGKQFHKLPALQKGERMHLFLLKQPEQHVPVRRSEPQ